MPTKIDPKQKKTNKIYPLPFWKETPNNGFYQVDRLDGELVEQFPKKWQKEHGYRNYGVPSFKPKQQNVKEFIMKESPIYDLD